ncbi:aldehyde dehydrogenase [Rhodovulum sp. 12E13]|uniref:type I glyceraldehyde-3-phosphate dehydrogenase n=1 Tax=Rhodovulum sp. 12E13 TaxID=2203891 RepID=UPI000E1A3328|nr:glyceraldehyde 3-phosphate dehydrogenase NAD-binding domain-containing protein [Rhodovulum sp. 12E13]RDC70962.1 aldehyde dehydrogenase [Rhodovulum sp. 12E13]
MTRPVRLAINGFGRIGRSVLRLVATGRAPGVEVVALNDIADAQTCAYLFRHDSVFGAFPGEARLEGRALVVEGRAIPFTDASDISALDLSGVDVVLECTGRAERREVAERGLRAGAGRVLISGPSAAAEATSVIGANEEQAQAARIVSNASCTTNALAPLLKLVDAAFGVESGHMTTIHCYTGSQPTVDTPRGPLERSRAAALSMVPTSTSAGRLVGVVLPDLADRVTARAVRVPTASVSAVDLMVSLRAAPTTDELRATLRSARGRLIGWEDEPLVSSDLRGRPESVILQAPEITVAKGGLARIFGWYDNEWGFSNRLIEMACLMAGAPHAAEPGR